MMAFDPEQARFNMVEQQIRPWEVLDPAVLDVLRQVPREQFVPESQQIRAFSDTALPIGHDEVMMPPVVEGRLLQALNVQGADQVLEIGTGTGYLTACLASLGASVHSVDRHADFTEQAQRRLGDLDIRNVRLETADVFADWSPGNRFEVIALTGAVATHPERFTRHLTVGGRLFAIVGKPPVMQAMLITRDDEEHFTTETLFETCLPWLRGAEPKPTFDF
ncbi:MAG: protein-L-isoaspartate O-methyltransferase family protein [Halothiobacillaceae bacterium]